MIRGNIFVLSQNLPPRAVRLVLSLGGLFCDRANLTPSDNKVGRLLIEVSADVYSEYFELKNIFLIFAIGWS